MKALPYLAAAALALFAGPAAAAADIPAVDQVGPPIAVVSQDFTPRNELERMLAKPLTNPTDRDRFLSLMLTSRLCAVPDQGAGAVGGLKTLRLNDGTNAVAMFSDIDRVAQALGAGTPTVCDTGRGLLERARGHVVILNPKLAAGMLFGPRSIDDMLGTPEVRVMPANQLQLSMPTDPPAELVRNLKARLGADPRIKAAWLSQGYWPPTKETVWMIDITSDAPPDDVAKILGEALRGADFGGRNVQMIVNRDEGPPAPGVVLVAPRP